MIALVSQPCWRVKCVEKYGVNKEGSGEMMNLLALVAKQEELSI